MPEDYLTLGVSERSATPEGTSENNFTQQNNEKNMTSTPTLPLSREEWKDFAMTLALNGEELESGMNYLGSVHQARRKGFESRMEAEKKAYEVNVEKVKDEIKRKREMISEADQRLSALQEAKSNVERELAELRLQIISRQQVIRLLRRDEKIALFKREDEHIQARTTSDLLVEIEAKNEVAKTILKIQLEQWEKNEDEYKRRAEDLEKEKERIEGEIKEAQTRINVLKKVGINKTSGGFLLWAGYASLIGVGGTVATLLQIHRASKGLNDKDHISAFVEAMILLFRPVLDADSLRPALQQAGLALVAILGLLLLVVLVTLVMNWVLGWFDESWRKSSRKQKDERSKRSNKRKPTQPPPLTPDVNRASLTLPEIDRSMYIKLLAWIPYVFVAAILILLLSLAGSKAFAPRPNAQVQNQQTASGSASQPVSNNPSQQAAGIISASSRTSDEWSGKVAAGLTTTYIGFIFTLLTVSVLLLYATKVIEPRWERLMSKSDVPSIKDYFKAHLEFILLTLLLAGAIVTVTLTDNAKWIWGGLSLFMCFSSLGLAYGIIQRGIFRDYDLLGAKRHLYIQLIERYKTRPTIDDILEEEDWAYSKDIMNYYRQRRTDWDEFRITAELADLFADEQVEDVDLLRYWLSRPSWFNPASSFHTKWWRRKLGWFKSWKDAARNLPGRLRREVKIISDVPDATDRKVAPKEAAEIDQLLQDKEKIETRRMELEVEWQDAGQDREGQKVRLDTLIDVRLPEAEAAQLRYYANYESCLKELEEGIAGEALEFQRTFFMGRYLHVHLQDGSRH